MCRVVSGDRQASYGYMEGGLEAKGVDGIGF